MSGWQQNKCENEQLSQPAEARNEREVRHLEKLWWFVLLDYKEIDGYFWERTFTSHAMSASGALDWMFSLPHVHL